MDTPVPQPAVESEQPSASPGAASPSEQPVVELTYPTPPESAADATKVVHTAQKRNLSTAIVGLVAVLILAAVGLVSFQLGASHGRAVKAAAVTSSAVAPLKLPQGALMINQCAPGQGTQYVLPADVTHGPIYNVYQGKVIGLEYYLSKADLSGNQSFLGMPLFNQKYDHIDIGQLSPVPTVSTVPEYHFNLYMISHSAAQAITCT